jgi:phage gpG-like protein
MIDFNVEFKGKGAALKAIEKIRSAIERKKVLKFVADEAVDLIKARTVTQQLDENDRPLIPSKRAERENGQTLSDKGHMLGAMRLLSVSADKAVIGFGDQIQAKKAWWAQDGTEPHVISAKNGKALAFSSSMSAATHMRGKGGKSKRITMANARPNAKGMVVAQRVHHPGTPKRPFFGISPKDSVGLQALLDAYLTRTISEASR